jgi:hypothetical protein
MSKLKQELVRDRLLNPPTEAQRRAFNIAMGIRRVRGVWIENYTPEELDAVTAARTTAGELAQLEVFYFLCLQSKHRPLMVEVPEHAQAHSCPLCGEYHLDLATRYGVKQELLLRNRLALDHMRRSYRDMKAKHQRDCRLRKKRAALAAQKGTP